MSMYFMGGVMIYMLEWRLFAWAFLVFCWFFLNYDYGWWISCWYYDRSYDGLWWILWIYDATADYGWWILLNYDGSHDGLWWILWIYDAMADLCFIGDYTHISESMTCGLYRNLIFISWIFLIGWLGCQFIDAVSFSSSLQKPLVHAFRVYLAS